jgi:hypothetical protein
MALLAWLTRLLISLAAGAGAGCLSFAAVVLLTVKPAELAAMYQRGPEPIPAVLGTGIGLIVSAAVMWLLSREQLALKPDPHAKPPRLDA